MKKQANTSQVESKDASPSEVVVAPELLAEAVRQKANEAGFAGMLVVAGQPGHLRIQTDAGNYPLPEGYDYIVLMLAKPEPTEPMVGWLRAEVGGLAALTEPVQGQNVVGQP